MTAMCLCRIRKNSCNKSVSLLCVGCDNIDLVSSFPVAGILNEIFAGSASCATYNSVVCPLSLHHTLVSRINSSTTTLVSHLIYCSLLDPVVLNAANYVEG